MGTSSSDAKRPLPERIVLHVVEPRQAPVSVLLCCAEADFDLVGGRTAEIASDDVHLISGIDRDANGLRDALVGADRQALVVICKTDALDSDAVRRAVECFGTRRSWTHRLLVLELGSRHSSSWIGSIHRTLSAMARRRSETRPSLDTASARGEILGAADRGAATEPEPAAAAVLLGRMPTGRRDEVGPIPAHVRAPGQRPGHLALVPIAADTVEEQRASISDAVFAAAETASGPVEPRRSLALHGGVAAIVTAAIVAVGWPTDEPLPVVDAPAIESTVGSAEAIVPPGPALAAMPLPTSTTPSAAAAGAPTPSVSAPKRARLADRLANAIDDGRIRRHDALFVWTEAEPASDWFEAANRCRARKVDGVRGWRLPTLGEARALRRAGVLPDVDAWTLSRVVDGEGNWVASAGGEFEGRDKSDATASAACVRREKS